MKILVIFTGGTIGTSTKDGESLLPSRHAPTNSQSNSHYSDRDIAYQAFSRHRKTLSLSFVSTPTTITDYNDIRNS